MIRFSQQKNYKENSKQKQRQKQNFKSTKIAWAHCVCSNFEEKNRVPRSQREKIQKKQTHRTTEKGVWVWVSYVIEIIRHNHTEEANNFVRDQRSNEIHCAVHINWIHYFLWNFQLKSKLSPQTNKHCDTRFFLSSSTTNTQTNIWIHEIFRICRAIEKRNKKNNCEFDREKKQKKKKKRENRNQRKCIWNTSRIAGKFLQKLNDLNGCEDEESALEFWWTIIANEMCRRRHFCWFCSYAFFAFYHLSSVTVFECVWLYRHFRSELNAFSVCSVNDL